MSNDYLAVANNVGANVVSQVDFQTAVDPGGDLEDGFLSGKARSDLFNKIIRQSSVLTAAITEFIATTNTQNMVDDGDVAQLAADFQTAIEAIAAAYGFADPMTTRGDSIVRNAANATARLAVGAAFTVMGSNGTDPSWGALPGFESSELTITLGTTVSAAHGLGAIPKQVHVVIRCKTTELGYAVGEEVQCYESSNGTSNGSSCYADGTNVGFTVNNSGYMLVCRKDGTVGTLTVIDNAKWKIVIRAYK